MREFLTDEQRAIIRARADRSGQTMAKLLRNAVDLYIGGGDALEASLPATSLVTGRRLLARFGKKLRETRGERHVSLRQLALISGIRVDVLQRIETGQWVPSEDDEATLMAWLQSES